MANPFEVVTTFTYDSGCSLEPIDTLCRVYRSDGRIVTAFTETVDSGNPSKDDESDQPHIVGES